MTKAKKVTKRKVKPKYKFTGKYNVGSSWDGRTRKIYKDKDGDFVFHKGRRIRRPF